MEHKPLLLGYPRSGLDSIPLKIGRFVALTMLAFLGLEAKP